MRGGRWAVPLAALLLVAACSAGAGPSPTATPSPVAGATTSATPSPAASASADVVPATLTLPPFQCGQQSAAAGAGRGAITAVRVGRSPGYDRFVIQFADALPGWKLIPQGNTDFLMDASGLPVHLEGSAGARLVLSPASGQGGYSGPTDLTPRLPVLQEARLTGDFEAVTSWSLGLGHPACARVFALPSPSRLVVDFQSP